MIGQQTSRRYAAFARSHPAIIVKIVLLLAAKGLGNFAEQLVLILPAGLECPHENLLEMIAVIHGGVKENNVSAFFGSS